MIKAVLFDHDGTLVDSESIHADLWINVLKKYYVEFTKEEYLKYHTGIPTTTNAKTFVDKYRMEIGAEELAQEKSSATNGYLEHNSFPLNPFVQQMLEYLKEKKIKMAIVTGADRSGIRNTIKTHDIEEYFNVIISGEDVENRKPAPDWYLLALEKLGLMSDECIAIEDSENGKQSADAAGLKCILLTKNINIKNTIWNSINK